MANPVYTCTIAGTDRAADAVLLAGIRINEVTNGVSTFVCRVESEDASLRPAKRQEVVITEDGVPIFGGPIRTARETGFGQPADGEDAIITEIEVDDFAQYFQRRFLDFTFAGGSLKDFAIAFTAFFAAAPFSVTLDAAQATGPTLPAMIFEVERGDEVLNLVAALTEKYGTPFQWRMAYNKVWGFYQASAVPAPWDLLESDFQTTYSQTGDVEVEPTDDTYANKIIVVGGSGKVVTTTDSFTGNGTATTFGPLKYKLTGPIPGTNIGAIGYAYVDETPPGPPSGRGALGSIGTANMVWEYDPATNTIQKVIGPAPGVGVVISIVYDGQVKFTVTALDAGEIAANGLWEDKIVDDTLEDPVLALAVAEAELARRLVQAKIVKYRTRRVPAPRPGQSQTITIPKRNINAVFTIVDVITEYEEGSDILIRTVTATSTAYEHWRQTLTRWWSPNLSGGTGLAPAGAGAGSLGPAPPDYSVQYNDPPGVFGGAYHVLYYDLFWDQPDPGDVRTKGLLFVTNGGIGVPGHIGITDPQRLEMGMLGSGDFSMDMFGLDASILINATGDIDITAGTPDGGSPDEYGRIVLVGNQSIVRDLVGGGSISPGIDISPGMVGDSHSRFHGLNIIEGLAGQYQTITTFPYTVHTTNYSNDSEILTFFLNGGTGTVNLPDTTAGNYRVFPNTFVGRMFFFKNIHASGVVTIDPFGSELIDGASTLTLSPGAGALIHRFDTSGWKVLLTTGGVTLGGGGGGGTGTPGGNDKDVQFNDAGVFGGEDAFEYDKTKDQLTVDRNTGSNYSTLRIRDTGGLAAVIALESFHGANYSDIAFGWERVNNVETARNTNPAYLYFDNSAGFGGEVSAGETAGNAMGFATVRGFLITPTGTFKVYQNGGLGTGAKTGCIVEIDRNSSGGTAAAALSLQAKGGTRYYIWVDNTGIPRIGTGAPEEDGTPSDTSGSVIGASTSSLTLLTADPASPADDTSWVVRTGTSPTMTVAVKARIAGATYTISSITI